MKLLIAVALLALACSKGGEGAKSAEPQSEPAPPPVPPPAPECVDANDEPVQCEMDEDCCKGFVCGRDPELSQIVKYCLYAG